MNLVTTPLRRRVGCKVASGKYVPVNIRLQCKSSYTPANDVTTAPSKRKQDLSEYRRNSYGERSKKGSSFVSVTSFPGTEYLRAQKMGENHAKDSFYGRYEYVSSSQDSRNGQLSVESQEFAKFDANPSSNKSKNTKILKSTAPESETITVDDVKFERASEVCGIGDENANEEGGKNSSRNAPNVSSDSAENGLLETSPNNSVSPTSSTVDSSINSTPDSNGVICKNSSKTDGFVHSTLEGDSLTESVGNGGKIVGEAGKERRMPLEFEESYIKFRSEEMALLTDDKHSCDMLEAVLKCPLKLNDWGRVTKKDRDLLGQISDAFDPKKLPSVTKIMQKTAPPMNVIMLNKWKKKKISELGEEGFQEYMKIITGEGHSFHRNIEAFLGREDLEIEDTGQWRSILPFLEKVNDVQQLEYNVSHSLLSYYGRIDCVAKYGDMLCVLDWKLSQKRKETLKKCYDDPYQVAAYAGAFNMSTSFDNQVSSAVVVKAYRDGTPADVHFMNEFVLTFYWDGWLRRLARHHVKEYNVLRER